MISRTGLAAAKLLAGVLLAGVASLSYATAFMYTHPAVVVGAMGICLILLTLPMWLGFACKPLRYVPAYYLLVLLILGGLVLGRFPVEALLRSADATAMPSG